MIETLSRTWREIHELPSGVRWKMYGATIILKTYATLMALGYGLLEADTLRTFMVVIAAGLAVDVLRNLFAPEARGTPREYSLLPRQLHEGIVKAPN